MCIFHWHTLFTTLMTSSEVSNLYHFQLKIINSILLSVYAKSLNIIYSVITNVSAFSSCLNSWRGAWTNFKKFYFWLLFTLFFWIQLNWLQFRLRPTNHLITQSKDCSVIIGLRHDPTIFLWYFHVVKIDKTLLRVLTTFAISISD